MKIAHDTLIMVADGSKMLLLRNRGDQKYSVLQTLSHEEDDNPPSRKHGTDTPGRTHSSTGERRSGYDETDWHTQAEEAFARSAAEQLEQAAQEDSEAPIIVIAAPSTLGVMRKHYGRTTKERLAAEIDKDLTGHSTEDIEASIAAYDAV